MKKMNIDEQTQLAEPIGITLEGKEYIVEKVSTELLKNITETGKSGELDAPVKQLALFLGVDPADFMGVDLRKIEKALEFISTSFQEGMSKPKNSPGEATPLK